MDARLMETEINCSKRAGVTLSRLADYYKITMSSVFSFLEK